MAYEIDSFVQKFKNLWHAGRNASLCIKSVAGKAQVDLSVELGEAPRPPAHHFRSRNGPARQRRRERRAASREEIEVGTENTSGPPAAVEADPSVHDSSEQQCGDDAEKATAEEVVKLGKEISAAEAASESCDFSCDKCDNNFRSVRALRIHEGRLHKANTGSRIPQLDGEYETLEECISYTFVSEYAVEDIKYTLEEIFPADVKTELVSRVRTLEPRSADHLCTIKIKLPAPQYFLWPEMNRIQEEVITDLTKI